MRKQTNKQVNGERTNKNQPGKKETGKNMHKSCFQYENKQLTKKQTETGENKQTEAGENKQTYKQVKTNKHTRR